MIIFILYIGSSFIHYVFFNLYAIYSHLTRIIIIYIKFIIFCVLANNSVFAYYLALYYYNIINFAFNFKLRLNVCLYHNFESLNRMSVFILLNIILKYFIILFISPKMSYWYCFYTFLSFSQIKPENVFYCGGHINRRPKNIKYVLAHSVCSPAV